MLGVAARKTVCVCEQTKELAAKEKEVKHNFTLIDKGWVEQLEAGGRIERQRDQVRHGTLLWQRCSPFLTTPACGSGGT